MFARRKLVSFWGKCSNCGVCFLGWEGLASEESLRSSFHPLLCCRGGGCEEGLESRAEFQLLPILLALQILL